MTLVLDRSGSMGTNGGQQALPIAVQTFLTYFSDSRDQVALATFASNATLDQAMGNNFTLLYQSRVSSMPFTGATYALGGMTLAQTQKTVTPTLANVVKVIVFFTDGIREYDSGG